MATNRMVQTLAAGVFATGLAACQGIGDLSQSAYTGATGTSSVSVDYYAIRGNSIQDLDSEIKTKGPKIARNRHAVAVARISMQPKMTYRRGADGCSVGSANVAVNARVTLPAWTGRAEAGPKLGAKWDSIDRYTRLHEAVHVAIAFRHARALEAKLIGLAPSADCAKARRKALALTRKALKRHDRTQQMFDRSEQRRIAAMRAQPSRSDDFGEPAVPTGLGLVAQHARTKPLTKSSKARARLRGT